MVPELELERRAQYLVEPSHVHSGIEIRPETRLEAFQGLCQLGQVRFPKEKVSSHVRFQPMGMKLEADPT